MIKSGHWLWRSRHHMRRWNWLHGRRSAGGTACRIRSEDWSPSRILPAFDCNRCYRRVVSQGVDCICDWGIGRDTFDSSSFHEECKSASHTSLRGHSNFTTCEKVSEDIPKKEAAQWKGIEKCATY